ncbi:hypothetical protein B296_00031063 [Ensete ventricosum]|uniref:Uncharacterized protein n=1 Tax=Ensete ventricosum TaxID=4639 RepID=A0A427AH87_ENSVE|nr:hypothetical protein B296_00031063 [Ensete ventricosum]
MRTKVISDGDHLINDRAPLLDVQLLGQAPRLVVLEEEQELELAVKVVDVVGGGEDGLLGGDPGSIAEPRLVDVSSMDLPLAMGERRENEEAGRWRGMDELLQQPRKQVFAFVFTSAVSTTAISLYLSLSFSVDSSEYQHYIGCSWAPRAQFRGTQKAGVMGSKDQRG